MRRAAPLAGALAATLVLAGCMRPEGVTDEDLVLFDAAVASVGCALRTERQYLPVELQTGMPREKIITIAQYRLSWDEARSQADGGVLLVSGPCAPSPDTDTDEERAT